MSYKNDLVLAREVLTHWREENYPEYSESEAFELFVAEQVLKDFDLSSKELSDGVCDGSNDGGLDSIYTFIGSELIDAEHAVMERAGHRQYVDPTIRLFLFQTKTTQGFPQSALDAAYASTAALLDLSRDVEDLRQIYNGDVCDRIDIFRQTLRNLAVKKPKVEATFVYCTLGDTSQIGKATKDKATQLGESFKQIQRNAIGDVQFLGATELWDRFNVHPKNEFSLKVVDSCSSDDGISTIVTLREYFDFLTTEDETTGNEKHLVAGIFDWNVRDYQGNVAVNKEIHESILEEEGAPFWWKNNGVTIIASKVNELNKQIHAVDPQIVNGLQTSTTIYETLRSLPSHHHSFDKKVQVRFLQTDDEIVRDQVIRATNKQTNVSDASLYATDIIQRDIEHYLYSYDWFYDRRKNYYKNKGMMPSRIIGIQPMAQLVLAAGLAEPDTARARPGTALKNTATYNRIFSRETPLSVYRWLCEADSLISENLQGSFTERSLRNNIKFYCLAALTGRKAGQAVHSLSHLASVTNKEAGPSLEEVGEAVEFAHAAFMDFLATNDVSEDAAAKGRDFKEHLFAAIEGLPG